MWRPARPEDDDAISALCARLYEEDPASDPVPRGQPARTLEVLRREPTRGLALVLELDRAVEGYALLISFWSNELGGEICTLDEIYVSAASRGRGHASHLVLALAKGEGPWPRRPVALELEVSEKNVRARALYERLGFVPRRNATLRRKLR
jgi:ribosomal protein S18 acetylase RimI-like enzyme